MDTTGWSTASKDWKGYRERNDCLDKRSIQLEKLIKEKITTAYKLGVGKKVHIRGHGISTFRWEKSP